MTWKFKFPVCSALFYQFVYFIDVAIEGTGMTIISLDLSWIMAVLAPVWLVLIYETIRLELK